MIVVDYTLIQLLFGKFRGSRLIQNVYTGVNSIATQSKSVSVFSWRLYKNFIKYGLPYFKSKLSYLFESLLALKNEVKVNRVP